MPLKDKDARREYQRQWRARNPGYGAKMHMKHQAKRLQEKRDQYAADPEKLRAHNRENYAKHAEKRAADQRTYRAANREKTNAEAVKSYHKNRDKRRITKRAHYERNYERIYAYIQQWRKRNPERELLYHAKRLLNEAVGIPIRDIPDELAEAKAEQIRLHRIIRGCDV